MANRYYDNNFVAVPATLIRSQGSIQQYESVEVGFDRVEAEMDLKAPLADPSFTGTQTFVGTADFSGATTVYVPTVTNVADNSTQVASTSFVQSVLGAAGSLLPVQLTHGGKFLKTNGTIASWEYVFPTQSAATDRQVLRSTGVLGAEEWHTLVAYGLGGFATYAAGAALSGPERMLDVMTAPNGSLFTLPDANTLDVGDQFTFFSAYNIGVAAGGVLHYASGGAATVSLFLSDNTTAAGVWRRWNPASGGMYSTPSYTALSGPTTVLRASRNLNGSAKIDDDRVLVAAANRSGGNGIDLLVVTVADRIPTPGAIVTVGTDNAVWLKVLAVTGGFAVVYAASATGAIKCIGVTVSGNVVTAGAATIVMASVALVMSTVSSALGYYDIECEAFGDKLLVAYHRSSTVVECLVVQVTGTTVNPGGTPGTLYTHAATTITNPCIDVVAISATSFFVVWNDGVTSEVRAVRVDVSGVTATPQTPLQIVASKLFCAACLVSSTQLLLVMSGGGGTGSARTVDITGGGATLSAGTPTAIGTSNVNADVSVVPVGAYFGAQLVASGGSDGRLANLSVSGTTVTLEAQTNISALTAPNVTELDGLLAYSGTGQTIALYRLSAGAITLVLSTTDYISMTNAYNTALSGFFKMAGKNIFRLQADTTAQATVTMYREAA